MVCARHQPGGLCLLLLLLCQFMEDRSAQGEWKGMRPEARLGQGFYFSVLSTWSVLTDAALSEDVRATRLLREKGGRGKRTETVTL